MSGFLFAFLLHFHSVKCKVVADDSILRSAFPGGCFFDSQQGTALRHDGEHFREICGIMCVTGTIYKYLVSFHRKVAKG